MWKFLIPSIPLSLLSALFTSIAHGLFLCSFLIAFCFYMGWVKRWLWLFAESELTKLTNGTPVTIGSLEYDLLKGNATATNVVLHQPQREDWKWDSPLLARIGRIHAEVNVPNLLFQILVSLLWTFQPPGSEPQSSIEVYSVLIWDAQVFIERRQYVFNFYLLDKTLELPDPTEILREEEDTATKRNNKKKKKKQISTSVMNLSNGDPTHRNNNNNNNNNIHSDSNDNNNNIDDDDGTSSIATDVSKEHANQLVNQMFSAVNSISRAAQQGSLKQQLLEQKNKFADRLKELRKDQGENFKVSDTVQQGARVMKHMSTAVVTQTQGVKVLPQVPKKKQLGSTEEEGGASSSMKNTRKNRRTVEEPAEELPPYVRIGRVVLKDVRIFTRYNHEDGRSHEKEENSDCDEFSMGEEKKVEDNIPSSSSEEQDDEVVEATQYGVEISRSTTPTMMNLTPERPTAATTSTTSSRKPTTTSGWNKPIYLEDVTVRAAELCPPMSLFDPETNLPAIYQRLDKVIDVVFKRILTEIAKSNTGKLLNTAMGELTSFMRISKATKSSSTTTTTTSSKDVKFASHTKSDNDNRTISTTSTVKLGEQSQHDEKVSISSPRRRGMSMES